MNHYVIIHVPDKQIIAETPDSEAAPILFASEEEALYAKELLEQVFGKNDEYIVLPLIDADDYLKGLS